jgi:hypothetical protein
MSMPPLSAGISHPTCTKVLPGANGPRRPRACRVTVARGDDPAAGRSPLASPGMSNSEELGGIDGAARIVGDVEQVEQLDRLFARLHQ